MTTIEPTVLRDGAYVALSTLTAPEKDRAEDFKRYRVTMTNSDDVVIDCRGYSSLFYYPESGATGAGDIDLFVWDPVQAEAAAIQPGTGASLYNPATAPIQAGYCAALPQFIKAAFAAAGVTAATVVFELRKTPVAASHSPS